MRFQDLSGGDRTKPVEGSSSIKETNGHASVVDDYQYDDDDDEEEEEDDDDDYDDNDDNDDDYEYDDDDDDDDDDYHTVDDAADDDDYQCNDKDKDIDDDYQCNDKDKDIDDEDQNEDDKRRTEDGRRLEETILSLERSLESLKMSEVLRKAAEQKEQEEQRMRKEAELQAEMERRSKRKAQRIAKAKEREVKELEKKIESSKEDYTVLEFSMQILEEENKELQHAISLSKSAERTARIMDRDEEVLAIAKDLTDFYTESRVFDRRRKIYDILRQGLKLELWEQLKGLPLKETLHVTRERCALLDISHADQSCFSLINTSEKTTSILVSDLEHTKSTDPIVAAHLIVNIQIDQLSDGLSNLVRILKLIKGGESLVSALDGSQVVKVAIAKLNSPAGKNRVGFCQCIVNIEALVSGAVRIVQPTVAGTCHKLNLDKTISEIPRLIDLWRKLVNWFEELQLCKDFRRNVSIKHQAEGTLLAKGDKEKTGNQGSLQSLQDISSQSQTSEEAPTESIGHSSDATSLISPTGSSSGSSSFEHNSSSASDFEGASLSSRNHRSSRRETASVEELQNIFSLSPPSSPVAQ